MLKVFLVEDESVIREGFRDKIPWEQYGFQLVGEAGDGEMALPMIRKLKPDLLITDIKMPFMDGLSLSEIVKEEFPKIKIIIISGYAEFSYIIGKFDSGPVSAETDYENDSPRRPAGDEGKNRAGDGTEGLSGPIPG